MKIKHVYVFKVILKSRHLSYSDQSDLESEFYSEGHTENAVVNNFESPRRSSRTITLTTTNEDMSYENMPRLQTE